MLFATTCHQRHLRIDIKSHWASRILWSLMMIVLMMLGAALRFTHNTSALVLVRNKPSECRGRMSSTMTMCSNSWIWISSKVRRGFKPPAASSLTSLPGGDRVYSLTHSTLLLLQHPIQIKIVTNLNFLKKLAIWMHISPWIDMMWSEKSFASVELAVFCVKVWQSGKERVIYYLRQIVCFVCVSDTMILQSARSHGVA